MTQYFEDMWLALEQEVSNYDNYHPDYSSYETPLNPDSQQQEVHLENQTYEDLLEIQKAPPPEHDKLRAKDRKERIEAVKELYNRAPTIINAKIRDIANQLYKKGFVKQGNSLMQIVTDNEEVSTITKGSDYIEDVLRDFSE